MATHRDSAWRSLCRPGPCGAPLTSQTALLTVPCVYCSVSFRMACLKSGRSQYCCSGLADAIVASLA